MIRNYITIAYRTLKKYKSYSFINILGLSVCITCCLIIFVILTQQLSYDHFHTHSDRIFKKVTHTVHEGELSFSGLSAFPWAEAIRHDVAQVENCTQAIFVSPQAIKVAENFFNEDHILFADKEFFKLFDYGKQAELWLAGNATQALSSPNTVVLTESIAKKYFNGQSAVGKIIRLDNKLDYIVSAVVQDPPANTSIPFSMVFSLSSFKDFAKDLDMKDFKTAYGQTVLFMLLPSQVNPAAVESQLNKIKYKYLPAEEAKQRTYLLQSIKQAHYNSNYAVGPVETIDKTYLAILGIIGIFILLVACINFVNLSTAQALNRAKEVGVRKVLGSKRSQLIGQFLCETVVLTGIASLLSLTFLQFLIPFINQFLPFRLAYKTSIILDLPILVFLLITTLVIGILAGLYPAFILSGYQPIKVLKGRIITIGSGKLSLQRGLVLLQFAISQALIIAMLIVASQLKYMLSKPLGFNKEAILTIPLTDFNKDAYQTLRNRLLKQPDIRQVSYSMGNPSSKDYFGTELKNAENPNSPVYQAMIRSVDKSYLDTYGLEVISGEWFHEEFTVWKNIHFVINEKLVKELGFKTAGESIGKKITALGTTAPITGVVKDFHVKSLHEAIEPVAMFNCPVYIGEAAIQVQDKNMPATLSFIENTWKEAFPDKAFTYTFLDEQLARYYQTESLIANAFNIFAGIAVLISCLGLFGLISFMVVSRTKEIGIRKVLGAPALHVMWLFSKEYVVLLSIAFAMAAPIAYYGMHTWLQSFIFHVEIGAGTFLMAAIVSVLTASLSVCYLIVKAARANPIQSLRNE